MTAKRRATRQELLQAHGPQGSASGSDQRKTPPPPPLPPRAPPPSPTPPPLLGHPRSAAPRQEAEKPHPGSPGSAPPPPAGNPHPGLTPSTLHRAPVGQGPPGPDWLAISFGFWSGRALATGTAWAGLCLIHHHHHQPRFDLASFFVFVCCPPPKHAGQSGIFLVSFGVEWEMSIFFDVRGSSSRVSAKARWGVFFVLFGCFCAFWLLGGVFCAFWGCFFSPMFRALARKRV